MIPAIIRLLLVAGVCQGRVFAEAVPGMDALAVRLVALAGSGGYLRNDGWEMSRLLRETPAGQFPALAEALLGAKDRRSRGQALHELCFVWAQKDPPAALAFAEKQGDRILFQSAFRGWAETDWRAAGAWLEDFSPGQRRDRLFAILMERVAVRAPREALALLLEETGRGGSPDTWHIMAICARRDPGAAAEAWSKLPPGRSKQSARNALARYWAQEDAAAAWQWASGLKTEKDRVEAGRAVVLGAAESDPEQAIGLLGEGKFPESLPDVRSLIVAAWAERNPDAAVRWVQELPEGEQGALFQAALSRGPVTNPAELLKAVWRLRPSRERDVAIGILLRQWGVEDFAAARAFAENPPAWAEPRLILLGLTTPLAEREPDFLLALFARLPEGKEKSHLRIALVSVLESLHPELVSRLTPSDQGEQSSDPNGKPPSP